MKFILYKDAKREWRWRLLAKNRKIIADSGEGYKRQGKCRRMVERIVLTIHEATIEIQ